MRTNFRARWFWNTIFLPSYCGALLLYPFDIPSCELVSLPFQHHRFFSMASLYGRDVNADRSSELSATTTIVLVLSVVFVALRFWARYVRIGYGTDDWLTLVALVFVFITGGLNYGMIAHGLGKHAKRVSTEDQIIFFKILLAFENIYVTAVMLIKLALLSMYLRIFPSRNFRLASALIAAVVIGWWIAICAVCIFQCHPIKKAWMPWIDGTCINLKASFIGNAIPNIATDVAILCLPVGQIVKLQVNMAQKLSLLVIFLLGSFVLFASIYRFTTIMQFDPVDTTWTLATACTWCVVEVACGTIALCLPTLRPLMLMISSKFESITSRKDAAAHTGMQAELVTIGGTGGKTGHFHRIDDAYEPNSSQRGLATSDGSIPHIDPSDRGSGDEVSLHQGKIDLGPR